MGGVTANLASVEARLRAAERSAGRLSGSVSLLAVSKTRPPEDVAAAAAAGQMAFGENQLQDALTKIEAPLPAGLEWHFIGPVQSNKTRAIASHFAWVHSIDRLKIAERLSDQRPPHLPPLQCCVQFNVSAEGSKSGVTTDQLPDLAAAVAALPRMRLRGLMAIPAPADDPDEQRAAFAAVRHALETLKSGGLALDTLSMGMTDDMEAAVAEGATMVRIGTAIFGRRARKAPL
ncbi:MAG: YggS family pyridoxal phosphate-dependent enzyme [Pseudomonadota bacterium]